ncbi:hypothetical protein Sjap_011770 [Stephania japonica]|uniref:Uncharacterized protein n=1 Tax=Stephania japonica TaxID=461633 RepID=A0AAP0JE18_9MAGN
MQKHGFLLIVFLSFVNCWSTPKIETFVLSRIENQWFGEPLNWNEMGDNVLEANKNPDWMVECKKTMLALEAPKSEF